MISPACVDAIGDLRALLGEGSTELFVAAHRREPNYGHVSILLELARLRAEGRCPVFSRECAPRTVAACVDKSLREMGLLHGAEGVTSDGRGIFMRGVTVRVPNDATEETLLAALLCAFATGSA